MEIDGRKCGKVVYHWCSIQKVRCRLGSLLSSGIVYG